MKLWNCALLWAGAWFGFIVGIWYGYQVHGKPLEREAVARGYAEKPTHNSFRWLDKPSPPTTETAVPPQPADQ